MVISRLRTNASDLHPDTKAAKKEAWNEVFRGFLFFAFFMRNTAAMQVKLTFSEKYRFFDFQNRRFTCIGAHFSWFSIFLRFFLFLGATSKILVLPACELNSVELE